MKFVSTSLKTKLASLNKANLYYLSQTSQNNLSKIFLWKSHFANITGRKTSESLNCFAFLGSKKKYHPRIQTFFKKKWNEVCLTYYANLSGTFPKKQNGFVHNDVTDSWALFTKSRRSRIRLDYRHLAMIGSTSSTQTGIIQPKWNSLWCSNG